MRVLYLNLKILFVFENLFHNNYLVYLQKIDYSKKYL